MTIKAGTVLQNGKYTIDAILGTGIILTCEATQTDLNLPVIIKTLNISPHRLRDSVKISDLQSVELGTKSATERLQTQFQMLSQKLRQCQHPNVVRILDNFSENGQFYSVMEYIRGQTLQELLDTGLEISATLAIDYIRQIGNALTELHHQGILHRNIKPQNIKKRQGSNSVVLIDFGILDYLQKAQSHRQIPKTEPSSEKTLFGGYAPIEQYLPHTELTTKSDIYSLSATLYCLLTGAPPLAAPLRQTTSPRAIRTFPTDEPSPPPLREIVQSANALGVKSAGNLRTYKNAKRMIQRQSRIEECLQRWNEFPSNLDPMLEQALRLGLEIDDINRPNSIEAWLALLPQTEEENQTPAITVEVPHSKETANPSPSLRSVFSSLIQSPTKRAFVLTAAIAGFFGASLGLSLRLGLIGQISAEILEVEQSFPPLKDWPISGPVEVSQDLETPAEQDLEIPVEQEFGTVRGGDFGSAQ